MKTTVDSGHRPKSVGYVPTEVFDRSIPSNCPSSTTRAGKRKRKNVDEDIIKNLAELYDRQVREVRRIYYEFMSAGQSLECVKMSLSFRNNNGL